MEYNQTADQSQNIVQAKNGVFAEMTNNTAENYLKQMVVNLLHKGAGAEVIEFALSALTGHLFFKNWADNGTVPYTFNVPRAASFFQINPNMQLSEEQVKSFNEELDYRLKMLKDIFEYLRPIMLSAEIFDVEMLGVLRQRGFKIANEPTEEYAFRIMLRGGGNKTVKPIVLYTGN
jgi:hypothetical protein